RGLRVDRARLAAVDQGAARQHRPQRRERRGVRFRPHERPGTGLPSRPRRHQRRRRQARRVLRRRRRCGARHCFQACEVVPSTQFQEDPGLVRGAPPRHGPACEPMSRLGAPMPGVRVVTDSSCDLPNDLAVEFDIDIVPLTIRFGDDEFVDRRDLSPKQFWARCGTSPVLPETAAPSAGAFEEAFRAAKAAGAEGVVCINLSSKLSATYQAAQMAATTLQGDVPVRVVDSPSATMCLGNIAIAAARLAAAGKSLDDVAGAAEDLSRRTRVLGTLDTLENLKKGGRIGGAKAMLGSMLSLKPVIWVVDGLVEEESKQRQRSP